MCSYDVSSRSDASSSENENFVNFVPPDQKVGQKASVNTDKDDITDWEAPNHKKKNKFRTIQT